jgi:hypothetical protein
MNLASPVIPENPLDRVSPISALDYSFFQGPLAGTGRGNDGAGVRNALPMASLPMV